MNSPNMQPKTFWLVTLQGALPNERPRLIYATQASIDELRQLEMDGVVPRQFVNPCHMEQVARIIRYKSAHFDDDVLRSWQQEMQKGVTLPDTEETEFAFQFSWEDGRGPRAKRIFAGIGNCQNIALKKALEGFSTFVVDQAMPSIRELVITPA